MESSTFFNHEEGKKRDGKKCVRRIEKLSPNLMSPLRITLKDGAKKMPRDDLVESKEKFF